MPRTVMTWTKPTVKIALTEAELTTAGLAIECQVNSAMLTPQPATVSIPATGCAPATNSPGATGFQLDLAWLQDWSAADAESLSRFAWDNDTEQVWVQVVPNKDDATTAVMTGPFFCVTGGYGGTFGDGSAGATTASWPAVDKPTIAPNTIVLAADADATAAA